MEESVAQIRWGSGGKHRAPVKDGLIVAVFRHYESRTGNPLLHDHAVVSIKARRPDEKGTWVQVRIFSGLFSQAMFLARPKGHRSEMNGWGLTPRERNASGGPWTRRGRAHCCTGPAARASSCSFDHESLPARRSSTTARTHSSSAAVTACRYSVSRRVMRGSP
ncbi:relaxase domain-containing protein [Streptomyces sp. NPDC005091]